MKNLRCIVSLFFPPILPLERHEIFDRGQDTGLKLDRTWPLEKPIKQVHALIRRIFASSYVYGQLSS